MTVAQRTRQMGRRVDRYLEMEERVLLSPKARLKNWVGQRVVTFVGLGFVTGISDDLNLIVRVESSGEEIHTDPLNVVAYQS